MSNPTFQQQIGDLWRTRPVRLPSSGHLAGVCSGIGYRYGVDPVLVRVAFVVSSIFGGAGILLYLAGWLLLTRAGDPASAAEAMMGRGHSTESGTKTVVLLVALAIAASTIGPFGVGMGGSGLISLLLMLAGIWFLHQRSPEPPPLPAGQAFAGGAAVGYSGSRYVPNAYTPTPFSPGATAPQAYGPYTQLPDSYVPAEKAPQTQAPAANEQAPADTAFTDTRPSAAPAQPSSPAQPYQAPAARTAQPAPPSWDPLGVAPFAWDLPEPATSPTPPDVPERKRSRLTPTFIGLAVLAAAGCAALAAITGSEWLTPGRIAAVALAVIGAGLLIGGLTRRGYGLLVVAGPLAGFVVLASLVGPLDFQNVGERQWAPTSAAELESSYNGNLGSFRLDLTGVQPTEDTQIDISNRFGEFIVIVPPDMNVRNECTTMFAESQCLPEGLNAGTTGPDGPVVTLDVDNQFGSVEVHRG